MKVKILLFASAREAIGTTSIVEDIGEDCCLNALLDILKNKYQLDTTSLKYSIAINKKYVRENVALVEGDEVAIIPPIGGG